MSRLSIEIDPEQHRQIKTLATFEGKTIKEFILSRTLPPADGSDRGATGELLASPKNRERLMEALRTDRKDYRVFETMDELKDALGI
jgi:uncharacterized protein (DUF1778 family)